MAYKLKKNQPEFDVVDGPDAGKKFRHGILYPTVPPGELKRFDTVKAPKPSQKPTPKKSDDSEAKTTQVKEISPKKGGPDK